MSISNLRRYGRLTYHAQAVSGRLTSVWKFLRQYHNFISTTYWGLVEIAEKRNIEIPKPLVEIEKPDKTFWQRLRS